MKKVAVIASRHWKALLGLNLFILLASVGSIVTAPRVWTATAQLILPTGNGSNLDVNLGTLGSYRNTDPTFSNTINPLKIQQAILTSDALLKQTWLADPEYDQSNKPRSYGGFFSITPVEQTSILSVSVSGSSPEIARKRADALLQTYQMRLNELRQANNTAREGFSQKQLEQARRNLSKNQLALAQFKRSTGLVSNEEQTKGMVETINTLSTAQAEATAQAQASADRARLLSARLNLSPTEAVQSLGLDQNDGYKYIRSKLNEVEVNLGALRSTFKDRSPQVQKLLADRETLRRQLGQYVEQAAGSVKTNPAVTSGAEGRVPLIQQLILAESEAVGQRQQAVQLQAQIAQRRNALTALPTLQARLAELQRQADVTEGVYRALVAQVQQSNIDGFNSYPNVQVLNPPAVDPKPSSPKNSVAALNALLASVIGSIAMILLLEARNPLLSPKDLQSLKFPLVVRIARRKHPEVEADLGIEAEVDFQRLASAISLQPLQDRRLLITSAMMGEGKTMITLQLATALTDLGFRVLVIDGDFRKAGLSDRLGYQRNTSAENQPVQIQQNLDFFPTLPRQGRIVDLVTRGRFEQYLATAQSVNDYDYVLIDSAPVGSTSETALMAAVIPNVLFVVRPGVSARNAVNDSLEQLTQHNAKVVGLVINDVEAPSQSYAYRSNAALINS